MDQIIVKVVCLSNGGLQVTAIVDGEERKDIAVDVYKSEMPPFGLHSYLGSINLAPVISPELFVFGSGPVFAPVQRAPKRFTTQARIPDVTSSLKEPGDSVVLKWRSGTILVAQRVSEGLLLMLRKRRKGEYYYSTLSLSELANLQDPQLKFGGEMWNLLLREGTYCGSLEVLLDCFHDLGGVGTFFD